MRFADQSGLLVLIRLPLDRDESGHWSFFNIGLKCHQYNVVFYIFMHVLFT